MNSEQSNHKGRPTTYIIVEAPSNLIADLRLDESQWKPSAEADYWLRVDAARPEMRTRRHVHIAHKQHTSAPKKQVSWNDDGTRHDRAKFDGNFKGIKTAKDIARKALALPNNAVLENVTTTCKGTILVEALLLERLDVSSIPIFAVRYPSRIGRALEILQELTRQSRGA